MEDASQLRHLLIDCATGEIRLLTHEEAIAHPDVAVDEHFLEERAAERARQAALTEP